MNYKYKYYPGSPRVVCRHDDVPIAQYRNMEKVCKAAAGMREFYKRNGYSAMQDNQVVIDAVEQLYDFECEHEWKYNIDNLSVIRHCTKSGCDVEETRQIHREDLMRLFK